MGRAMREVKLLGIAQLFAKHYKSLRKQVTLEARFETLQRHFLNFTLLFYY